jgi:hypothetical protein
LTDTCHLTRPSAAVPPQPPSTLTNSVTSRGISSQQPSMKPNGPSSLSTPPPPPPPPPAISAKTGHSSPPPPVRC